MSATPPDTSAPRHSRLTRNLAANHVSVIVVFLIGVWYTPYVIHHLGKDAYGLVPLIGQVLALLRFAIPAVSSYASRTILMAIEQRNEASANRVFNTVFWIFSSVAAVLLVLGLALTWNLQHALDIAPLLVPSAQWYMLAVLLAACLSIAATPYSIVFFCRNRFDLQSLLGMMQRVIDVLVVVVGFWLFGASLKVLGAAALLSCAIVVARNRAISRRLLPFLKLQRGLYDRRVFTEMLSYSSWQTLGTLGASLAYMLELVVANRMCGSLAAAHYAIALTLPHMVQMLGAATGAVFVPTLIGLYATGDLAKLVARARQSTRLVAVMLSLPVGGIMGFALPFLSLWLQSSDLTPTEFSTVATLTRILTWSVAVSFVSYPLGSISMAMGEVRLPNTVICIFGVATLGLSVVLASAMGIVGVALAAVTRRVCETILFYPVYQARLLRRPWWTFLGGHVLFAILVALVWLLATLVQSLTGVGTWVTLLGWAGVIAIAYAAIVWSAVLSPAERGRLTELWTGLGKRARTSPRRA